MTWALENALSNHLQTPPSSDLTCQQKPSFNLNPIVCFQKIHLLVNKTLEQQPWVHFSIHLLLMMILPSKLNFNTKTFKKGHPKLSQVA